MPAVVSHTVMEGLPEEVRPACRVSPDADGVAAAVLGLLDRAPAERRRLAGRAELGASAGLPGSRSSPPSSTPPSGSSAGPDAPLVGRGRVS